MERDIDCVVYPSLPQRGLFLAFLPSAGVWESPRCVRCEMIFSRTHPERTSTTRVHNSEPFAVWFVGALDESDTSRTQVALDDYVDWVRSIPTPEESAYNFPVERYCWILLLPILDLEAFWDRNPAI